MPMGLALAVRLRGEMPAAKLRAVRELLGLTTDGRLGDEDDSSFGHRALGQDVLLDMYRHRDAEWRLRLTYRDEPPDAATVERCRLDILAAAERLGLAVESVWVSPGTRPGRTPPPPSA
jgi:hypothetical protein